MACSTLGATVGVSIGQAIWTSELRIRTAVIPNFESLGLSSTALASDVRQLQNINVRVILQIRWFFIEALLLRSHRSFGN
jgi:hypothetical protein